jgi:mannitol/fructose-specific phosphotransferase system IIA component (Ntr-type)
MIESRLSAVLAEEDIQIGFVDRSIEDALPRLLRPALERAGVGDDDTSAILEAVADRERSASTISAPVALPHARHERAPRIVAALAINGSGTLDRPENVEAILAFVSPTAATAEHLRFLAASARLFRSADVLGKLTSARTPAEVLGVLREHGV